MASRRSNPASIYHLAPGKRWVTNTPGVEFALVPYQTPGVIEARTVFFHGKPVGDIVYVEKHGGYGWRVAGSHSRDVVTQDGAISMLLAKEDDRRRAQGANRSKARTTSRTARRQGIR